MWETIGDPVRGGHGRVQDVPGHVRIFRDDMNKVNETYARTTAESGERVEGGFHCETGAFGPFKLYGRHPLK